MKAQFIIHILKILKKWLFQFARIPTKLLVSFLSILRRFATYSSKLGDRPTRFGALQGDVEDVLICSSLPGSRFPEVVGGSSSLSDIPYSDIRAQPPRSDAMEMSSLKADSTSATESYEPRPDSVPSLHLHQQAGESGPVIPSKESSIQSDGDGRSSWHIEPELRLAENSSPEACSYDSYGDKVIQHFLNQTRRPGTRILDRSTGPGTKVPAMMTAYPLHEHPTPPQGWNTVVHPEGSLYFVNTETRTSTNINICDREKHEEVEHHMKKLLGRLQDQLQLGKLQLDMKDLDLVVISMASSIGYYFINHQDKCLF